MYQVLLLLLFSCWVVSDSLQPQDCGMPGLLSFTIFRSLLRFMSIESTMLFNHLILCHLLLLAFNLFQHQGLFQWVALLIRCPKYWSFSLSISPSSEYSGLISFRVDWLDLLVQRTLESSPAPQFESINSSTLSCLYSPSFTFIHDNWKNHSLDCMDLCQQRDISAF